MKHLLATKKYLISWWEQWQRSGDIKQPSMKVKIIEKNTDQALTTQTTVHGYIQSIFV